MTVILDDGSHIRFDLCTEVNEDTARQLLGVSASYLRYLRKTGKGPSFTRRGPRTIRYPLAEVIRFNLSEEGFSNDE